MPRKQRFKPSRKPKPAQNPTTEQTSSDQLPNSGRQNDPGSEPAKPSSNPGDIESGGPMRTREDTSSVVEDVGSEVH